MTAIPADLFQVASSRSRRVGRVLEALLGTLWGMKLAREGMVDAEDKARPVPKEWRDWRIGMGRGDRHYFNRIEYTRVRFRAFAPDSGQRRDFYRYIEQGRWTVRDPKDRRIADALAEGASYREIMRKERVGQFRVERVLFTLVNGRTPPWHWRAGRPREKAGQKKRQLVERKWRRRRRDSTQP